MAKPQTWPLIGVTSTTDNEGKRRHYLFDSYTGALERAHCAPLIIPVPDILLKDAFEDIAERIIAGVDGLLLSGGEDVDARLYHEENYPFTGAFTEERDLFEFALCRSAVRHGKPILGICRGIQALNAAMGGSLFQDIIAQHPDKQMLMHTQKAPPYSSVHDVELAGSSLLARIILDSNTAPGVGNGADKNSNAVVPVSVNSFHHQAIHVCAPGFVVTAHARDGIIEAIEPGGGAPCLYGKPHPFTIGVQWHPERMDRHHAHAARLFSGFAAACAGGDYQ
jgi:putative glutamine amidotransferase